ncbi:MAG: hypothetical protein KJO11_11095 [Gemmatimonadetes bacterium]|nr:hypothetical protein [Gemmatimonadota bacterium]MBT8402659.1 hypothetical protein [Gemmatimonadota bacterium]
MSRAFGCFLLMVVMGLPACAGMQPYDPAADPGARLPERIRLVLHSRERVTLNHPTLNGDSVYVGIDGDSEVRRIPATEVDSIYGGQIPGAGQDLLQLVGGMGLAFLGIVALVMSGG